MKFKLGMILFLSILWMVLWNSLTIQNFITGCAIATLLSWIFRAPKLSLNVKVRPFALLKLMGYFLYSLIQSSIIVGWYAIMPKKIPQSEIVRIKFSLLYSDFVQVLAVDFLILVPGTLVVDFDVFSRELLVHHLDTSTVANFARELQKIEILFHNAFESHREIPPGYEKYSRIPPYTERKIL